MKRILVAGLVGVVMILLTVSSGVARAADPTCNPAGSTGLTAAVIAQPNQVFSGTIDATGCNVGIYVGPGVTGVMVVHATVSGADDHGIFAQDTSGLVIKDSTITGNGVNPHVCDLIAPAPCIPEDKAVQLSGVSFAVIKGNDIHDNHWAGLGISDDGPIDPGALTTNPGGSFAAVGNVITGNHFSADGPDCAIVVAAYNAGVGAFYNVVTLNVVLGTAPGTGGYDGQIVVAADGPGTTVDHTVVANNVVDGSLLPGIVVHSNVGGDVISNTIIVHNLISDNGVYPEDFATVNTPVGDNTTGIALIAETGVGRGSPDPVVTSTRIVTDTVMGDRIGVWLCSSSGTAIVNLGGDSSTPVTTCAAGGS